jgi:hypothetical protein
VPLTRIRRRLSGPAPEISNIRHRVNKNGKLPLYPAFCCHLMAVGDKNKIPVNSRKDQSPLWMLKTNAKRSKEATLKPSYATDKRGRIEKFRVGGSVGFLKPSSWNTKQTTHDESKMHVSILWSWQPAERQRLPENTLPFNFIQQQEEWRCSQWLTKVTNVCAVNVLFFGPELIGLFFTVGWRT